MATEGPQSESVVDGSDTAAAPTPQSTAIPDDLFCPQCGYNLRGLTSDRCPECGHSIEGVRPLTSGIPWVHRKQLGSFRAYWKTVWLVMFNQKRLCDEIAHPVSYADSQSFRWITILHAYLPVLLVTVAYGMFLPAILLVHWFLDGRLQDVCPRAGLHLCFVLFLAASTGVPSYFFQPRGVLVSLQNRAIALSYYASAPLALTFVPVLALMVITTHTTNWIIKFGLGLCLVTSMLVTMVLAAAWWLNLIRLSRRVVSKGLMWPVVVGVCVPVLWVILAWFIFSFALSFAVSSVLVIIQRLA